MSSGSEVHMADIRLLEPSIEYAGQIEDFRNEVLEADADCGDIFAGCFGMSDMTSGEDWIRISRLLREPATSMEAGAKVGEISYLAVREIDDRLVGIICLRFHIDHPILSVWGGHVGYTVRPSERRKGYATEMIRQVVGKAREIGIPKILITCDDSNAGSEKAIVNNGGVYEYSVDVDGAKVKRYWIDCFSGG